MTLHLLQEKYSHILDEGLLKEITKIGVYKAFNKNDIIIVNYQPDSQKAVFSKKNSTDNHTIEISLKDG